MTTGGFFKSLFDTSFSSLVTPRLLSIFWLIFLVVWSVMGAGWLIIGLMAASQEPVMLLFTLIGVPTSYLIGLIFYRMIFEVVAAFFRMADDIRDIRGTGRP